jgi:hypothetical protein
MRKGKGKIFSEYVGREGESGLTRCGRVSTRPSQPTCGERREDGVVGWVHVLEGGGRVTTFGGEPIGRRGEPATGRVQRWFNNREREVFPLSFFLFLLSLYICICEIL